MAGSVECRPTAPPYVCRRYVWQRWWCAERILDRGEGRGSPVQGSLDDWQGKIKQKRGHRKSLSYLLHSSFKICGSPWWAELSNFLKNYKIARKTLRYANFRPRLVRNEYLLQIFRSYWIGEAIYHSHIYLPITFGASCKIFRVLGTPEPIQSRIISLPNHMNGSKALFNPVHSWIFLMVWVSSPLLRHAQYRRPLLHRFAANGPVVYFDGFIFGSENPQIQLSQSKEERCCHKSTCRFTARGWRALMPWRKHFVVSRENRADFYSKRK